MTERPEGDADPDATVMLPSGGAKPRAADEDATVMIPAPGGEDDATVMMPAAAPDEDATVMMPPRAAEADADATVMMPSPEPAAPAEPDPEATIAIPTPGRKREAEAPAPPAAGSEATAIDPAALGGLNPLVAAANPILAIAAQIRHTLKHPDPQGLRSSLDGGIAAFEQAARAAGAGEETIAAASLALRALVHESAASTPWGAGWKTDETEKFFALLDASLSDAASGRDLLEFFCACLALGFEGREGLAERRALVLERLRALRSAGDGELSGHWRGVQAPARRPAGALGLWAAASAVALVLAGVYAAYRISLGGLSDPVARELAQLKAPPAQESRPAAQVPSPRIADQLAAEIARGEVAVADAAGMSTITIRSDRLFASGSARLEPAVEPVVLRVAEALDRVPGSIVVTGHTDDVPIRTARFPSNWELSTERAGSVVRLMAGRLKDAGRLSAEGLADSAPAAPNDSAANRARNRRVEIILRSAP